MTETQKRTPLKSTTKLTNLLGQSSSRYIYGQ